MIGLIAMTKPKPSWKMGLSGLNVRKERVSMGPGARLCWVFLNLG